MATIPLYEIGVHTSSISVWAHTANATTGVLEPVGSALSLLATVESARVAKRNRLVNLSPMSHVHENNVKVEEGTTFTFTGLMTRPAGTNNARATIFLGDYCRCQWVEAASTWDFYGIIESYEQETNKERASYTLTVRHVDITTTNPTLAAP